MASRRPTKGHRTSTGSREIHVTVTRDRLGRKQYRDTVSGQYVAVYHESRRQAELVDRVDSRLRWGKQTDGWWFIPLDAGGTHNWVRQRNEPTVIGGYLFKPGRPFPYSTPERPGPLNSRGRPDAPYGTPLSGAVPWDVRMAALSRGRHTEPSSKHEQFKARRTRVDEGYTDRYRTRTPKKKK